jgi:hypothetical protein
LQFKPGEWTFVPCEKKKASDFIEIKAEFHPGRPGLNASALLSPRMSPGPTAQLAGVPF